MSNGKNLLMMLLAIELCLSPAKTIGQAVLSNYTDNNLIAGAYSTIIDMKTLRQPKLVQKFYENNQKGSVIILFIKFKKRKYGTK